MARDKTTLIEVEIITNRDGSESSPLADSDLYMAAHTLNQLVENNNFLNVNGPKFNRQSA